MTINKTLLKRLKLLYVEDEDTIRNELSLLLGNFFGEVFTAKDGKEGLELFYKNKKQIDIILTDINMPLINGIDMIKQIRELDSKIPVFFATAHSDNEFLAEAIKLKVYEYIVKPIDIRKLLIMMSELSTVLYQDFLLEQQKNELERYKEITDTNNIVIKTDTHMKITYVNDLFCKISGFSKDELIGKEIKTLKYPDVSNDIFTDMYSTVLSNKPWKGKLKNIKKDGDSYTTDCYMITTLDSSGEIDGTISIQVDITEDLHKKREIQLALMKDKSDIFIRSKEGSVEQNHIINDLKLRLEKAQTDLEKALKNIDRYIYTNEKYRLENKNLKTELGLYKKNANTHTSLKLVKENAELRMESKKDKERINSLEQELEKEISQLKVNYNEKINDLEEKISQLTDDLEAVQSDEVLLQKLEYWKEKAKNESSRIEHLEKQIIAHADISFMSKIFG